MFNPKYTITDKLLANIKKINNLIIDLNNRRFPKVILLEFEKIAKEVSAYASTSIEGNPLPLTEVKKILKSNPVNIRNSEREVINYNKALENLNRQIQSKQIELSMGLILKINKLVTAKLLPDFESGKLRQKPVVVNDPKTGKVVFLPPDIEKVKDLIGDLILFIKQNNQKINYSLKICQI